jgi:hypothetical protein
MIVLHKSVRDAVLLKDAPVIALQKEPSIISNDVRRNHKNAFQFGGDDTNTHVDFMLSGNGGQHGG